MVTRVRVALATGLRVAAGWVANGFAVTLAMSVATLTLAGCNSPPEVDYSVSIDSRFTADQLDAISAGLTDWERAVSQLRLASSISACSQPLQHQVCIRPAYDAPVATDDVVGSTNPGAMGGADVALYIDRIQATGMSVPLLTEQTTAHELGHAFGLKHTGPGELMAPDVADQAHVVTAADVAQFWTVRGQ